MEESVEPFKVEIDPPDGTNIMKGKITLGFKGKSFLSAGMQVLERCGHCKGDLCAECDWQGIVLTWYPDA